MKAQYTKLFSEWIKDNSSQWEAFSSLLDLYIPKFELDMIPSEHHITISKMLEYKYKNREIGQETDDLFFDALTYAINKVIVKYASKVKLYFANIDKMMDRTIQLSNSGNELNYLYPASNSSQRLDSKYTFENSKGQAFGYFKTNPELLQQILELKDIYNSIVDEFEFCFLGVY